MDIPSTPGGCPDRCKLLLYVMHTWSSPDHSGVYDMWCHGRREVRQRRRCVRKFRIPQAYRAGDAAQLTYYAHRMTFSAE